ncbi:MAG TPA: hypothetical protein HA282_03540 [Nanoarchaeota archaeon]|nr:hypothetical protein [Nanoarchaeota archaeon]HIH34055.1 hypothetical protein [Nanoarchaeota archaeon]HIH51824.1 hypothetical protein [Nanoarchaeota archaeon]HIH66262.1 hypothetical protein [Nanoarchaeota archaeon]
MEIENRINLAVNWLLSSGIQSEDGGFNSWYDVESRSYKYKYSEITGYGLSTLVSLIDISADRNKLLERANLAAEWLINNATHVCNGFKTRSYYSRADSNNFYSFDTGKIFSFDTGMVIKGLLNLYKINKNEALLDASKKAAEFLINKMSKPDGLFYATYDPELGKNTDSEEKWSSQSGSYHAKIAIPLLNLYSITDNKSFLDRALSICDSSLELQKSDGRFISFSSTGDTHLHPHIYTTEGLVYLALNLKDEKRRSIYLDSTRKAIEWVLDNQKPNGGLPQAFYSGQNRFNMHERVDITAQALRISSILLSLGELDNRYHAKIGRLFERLKEFQRSIEDKDHGGFNFGYDHDGFPLVNHVNSWCTMFSLQAIMYYKQLISGQNIKVDFLI